jgi:hypothetical protein
MHFHYVWEMLFFHEDSPETIDLEREGCITVAAMGLRQIPLLSVKIGRKLARS